MLDQSIRDRCLADLVAVESGPCLAASVTDKTDNQTLKRAQKNGLAIAELRVDLCAQQQPEAICAELQRLKGYDFQRLLTIRAGFEGGEWQTGEAERLAVFTAAMPVLHAVDIELAADSIRESVIEQARKHDVVTVVSHHDFATTPASSELNAIYQRAAAAQADIVKIACTANSPEDVQRLALFLLEHNTQPDTLPLVVIAMGLWGASSRVLFPMLGSQFTFTHLGEASAPGQLSLPEMQAAIATFYP